MRWCLFFFRWLWTTSDPREAVWPTMRNIPIQTSKRLIYKVIVNSVKREQLITTEPMNMVISCHLKALKTLCERFDHEHTILSWTHYFLTKSEQFWLFHSKDFCSAFFPWALHTDLMWVGSVVGLLSGCPGSDSSLHADRQRAYSAALGKDKENEPTDLKALGGHALPSSD